MCISTRNNEFSTKNIEFSTKNIEFSTKNIENQYKLFFKQLEENLWIFFMNLQLGLLRNIFFFDFSGQLDYIM